MALFCYANRELNFCRRDSIKPDLQGYCKLLCSSQISITKFLFGDNLQNDMTEIRNSNRLTQPLANSSTQSIRYHISSRYYLYHRQRPFLWCGRKHQRMTQTVST